MEISVDTGNNSYSDIDGVLFGSDKTELCAFPGGKCGGYSVPEGTKTIADQAFRYCSSLNEMDLPSSLESIGNYAFSYCGITSITIPENVQYIDNGIFEGCTSLQNIYVAEDNQTFCDIDGVLCNKQMSELIMFPSKRSSYAVKDGIRTIRDSAFANSMIADLTLPSSLETICKYAFDNCCGLTEITIPKNVTSIERGAFRYCRTLEKVQFDTSDPSIYPDAFEYANNNLTLIGHKDGRVESFADSTGIAFESLGHTWNAEASVTTSPTCTEAGEKAVLCSDCGLVKAGSTEPIAALGHEPVADPAVAATCESAGLTEGSHCSRCSAVLAAQEAVPALGHDYTSEVTVEPTCESEGVRTYTCSRCKGSYTEPIAALPTYNAIEGDEAVFSKGNPAPLVFRFSGEASKFNYLEIDDTQVPKGSYRVTSGSTVISIESTYLEGLANGKHSVKAYYDDGGIAMASFTVAEKSASEKSAVLQDESQTLKSDTTSVKTGDELPSLIVVSLLLIAASFQIAAIAAIRLRRRN